MLNNIYRDKDGRYYKLGEINEEMTEKLGCTAYHIIYVDPPTNTFSVGISANPYSYEQMTTVLYAEQAKDRKEIIILKAERDEARDLSESLRQLRSQALIDLAAFSAENADNVTEERDILRDALAAMMERSCAGCTNWLPPGNVSSECKRLRTWTQFDFYCNKWGLAPDECRR